MKKENKDLFAKAEKVEMSNMFIVNNEEELEDEDTNNENEVKLITEDFKPQVNSKSKIEIEQERGVKKNVDGQTLTIESIKILPPKTKKLVDGKLQKILPKLTKTNKEYYPSKLEIRFKEDNLVEYYPGINFWVNNGVVNPNITINRTGHTKVAQLFKLALQKMTGKFKLEQKTINERQTFVPTKATEKDFELVNKTISDQEILDWLQGKKVEIIVSSGNYDGRNWFRNDIKAFL